MAARSEADPHEIEALRALIEQADAVCQQAEATIQDADRRMKALRPYWPSPWPQVGADLRRSPIAAATRVSRKRS